MTTAVSSPATPTCLVCEGTGTTRSLWGGYRFLGAQYYRLRCRDCGFIFVHPTPGATVFEAMYGDEYFDEYYGGGDAMGYEASAEVAISTSDAILARVARYVPSGSVLDVGCAGGYFLAAAKKRGYHCLGIELNPAMAQHARSVFGVEVINGLFDSEALVTSGRRFDVVYMGDALEHLPDPRGALESVRRVLTPGGVFVLNGPLTLNRSLFTYVLRLKLFLGKGRSEWYADGAPHHLWEWNAATQRRFLVDSAFDVIEFSTEEEKGRPAHVLTSLFKRPLTLIEKSTLRLKDLSAWCTNSLFRRFEWGDRVVAICRRSSSA